MQKLSAVDQQTVNDGNVVLFVELIDEGTHDRDVDAHVPQLVKTQVILNNRDDVASNAVDVGVYGQP